MSRAPREWAASKMERGGTEGRGSGLPLASLLLMRCAVFGLDTNQLQPRSRAAHPAAEKFMCAPSLSEHRASFRSCKGWQERLSLGILNLMVDSGFGITHERFACFTFCFPEDYLISFSSILRS